MVIVEKKPAFPTEERLHEDLRGLEWAKSLSDETLTAITNMAEWVEPTPELPTQLGRKMATNSRGERFASALAAIASANVLSG